MKHLLSAIAVAALMGSVPAWAQTSSSDPSQQPMPQAGSSGKADSSAMDTGKSMVKAHHKAAMRGGGAPEDNMAEELNRQEFDRVTHNGGETSGSGMPPNGMSGTTAPAASGATGAMPNTPHTGAEAGSKERGSPSPAQTEDRPGASSKD
jgi:hypothetical protein